MSYMIIQNLFIFAFLGVLGAIDVMTYDKEKGYIPSILTSTYILIALIIAGSGALYGGLIALAAAFVFNDLEMWAGWADFKIYVGTSIIIADPIGVLIFSFSLSFVAFFYKWIAKYRFKAEVIPFIPAVFVAYALFLLLSYLWI